jgi:magnesium-transporting ATPase (P-type)
MQFFHVFNCRSEYLSVFRVPLNKNRVLVLGMLTAFVIQIFATELPFLQSILRTSPIPMQTWLLMGGIASVVLIVMEIYKKIQSREDNAFYQGQQ